ncbi:MAG: HAD family phosphatase [Thermoplasmata archaeon]
MNSRSRFKLVVFDMDGVLVDINSSWSWIHQHFGVNNDESLKSYIQGDIDDKEFMRRDIALWLEKKPSLSKRDIEEVLKKVPIMKGCKECLETLRNQDYITAVVSGGIRALVKKVGVDYFDWIMVNDIEEGLTGEGVLEVPLNDKGKVFRSVLRKAGVSKEYTAAVGNSFIDVPMLKEAGFGIAFNPDDEEVCQAADVVVDEKDLRLILEYLS